MFDALTVREHLEYVRMAYDSEITDEEIEKILKAFEMDDKQDKLGNELSKGMMQKVSIDVYKRQLFIKYINAFMLSHRLSSQRTVHPALFPARLLLCKNRQYALVP